ncbi:tRNA1(Val) (adenine(37)-N6)-methyltransferase [Ferrimonas balearica]|uniref:tRNA1(Val) (adenine(37)-N6)-methyltransferase n=1 Tax=Ferrimonas balearica TaxID=44012 RepID=UPI001C98EAA0|nr:tRNA1(Val) (adenine(37)-N6)-methyltransferase [Ferrimonas balearica]MBY5921670.1 tRNA1(Val) (adenine(37)-N6)-methyltransferase [Ferrimonas balearica]MBY5994990.1 tRNA1(Val) (adenine(37)-N6)-methyltransferase [Ferrimonas balearica]
MPFTFKQFHVDDRGCGMPVSTDGVVLGAWARLPDTGRVLDLGTGSGLLALMCAQRSAAHITAVELDEAAARQAQDNFEASPWPERLALVQADIRQWQVAVPFDAIICNPPYFTSGERSQRSDARALARHVDTLSHSALLNALARLLHPEGCASLILPVVEAAQLIEQATDFGLHLQRRCALSSRAGKPAQRWLLQFGAQTAEVQQEDLMIHGQDGGYSEAFCALTQDFYLKMGS